jgi:hypothetical protein
VEAVLRRRIPPRCNQQRRGSIRAHAMAFMRRSRLGGRDGVRQLKVGRRGRSALQSAMIGLWRGLLRRSASGEASYGDRPLERPPTEMIGLDGRRLLTYAYRN